MGSRRSFSRHVFASGFSLVEVLAVAAIAMIVAAMAIPAWVSIRRSLRISGNARSIAEDIALAKMRAAANFTQARLYTSLSGGTFRVDVWSKTGAGSWVTEGGTQSLSTSVTFGFSGLGSAPPNTQAAIGQAAACLDNTGAAIAQTACIVFNSRGIPVDSTGAPTGNGAIYVTDGNSVYGSTISATGLIQAWRSSAMKAGWQAQ